MTDLTSLARGVGWVLAFTGVCSVPHPVFSFFARLDGRGLDRRFAGPSLVTGNVVHLPLFVLSGAAAVIAGVHLRGWATCREQGDAESNGGQQQGMIGRSEKYNAHRELLGTMSSSFEAGCPDCGSAEFYQSASMQIQLGRKKKWRCTDCEYGFVTINGINTSA